MHIWTLWFSLRKSSWLEADDTRNNSTVHLHCISITLRDVKGDCTCGDSFVMFVFIPHHFITSVFKQMWRLYATLANGNPVNVYCVLSFCPVTVKYSFVDYFSHGESNQRGSSFFSRTPKPCINETVQQWRLCEKRISKDTLVTPNFLVVDLCFYHITVYTFYVCTGLVITPCSVTSLTPFTEFPEGVIKVELKPFWTLSVSPCPFSRCTHVSTVQRIDESRMVLNTVSFLILYLKIKRCQAQTEFPWIPKWIHSPKCLCMTWTEI